MRSRVEVFQCGPALQEIPSTLLWIDERLEAVDSDISVDRIYSEYSFGTIG
jgi:hypothetical protein